MYEIIYLLCQGHTLNDIFKIDVDIVPFFLRSGHVLGGNVAAVKPMMAFVGVDLGPPRHPMRPMTVDELLEFQKDMHEIGFQRWDPAVMPS